MMVHARQHLESKGFEVVRGFMAITPTERMLRKGAEAVTEHHRLLALQIGCDALPETRGWLVPEPRGVHFGSGGQLIKGLSAELYREEPDATIFKVIGADTAVRYKSELKGPTVVVCRDGSTAALRAAIKDGGHGRNGDLFLVEELPGEECSSTKIRNALRLQDESVIRRLCPEPVAEYLLAHREELYGGGDTSQAAAGYELPYNSKPQRENFMGKQTQQQPDSNAMHHANASMLPAETLTASSAPLPAPGPGDGVTAESLKAQWAATFPTTSVLGFYGHGVKAGEYRCFSNFFDQEQMPFDFVVPAQFCARPLEEKDCVVQCDFSEKAIMLCKAAATGDLVTFEAIKSCTDPATAKRLGRQVQHFDSAVWDRIVCSVAFEVVYQKFSKTAVIRDVLLETGDRLIAEATRNDKNWGIGLDVGDARVQSPSKWQGSNILGWALMETRNALRHGKTANGAGSQIELVAQKEPSSKAKAKRWGGKKD